ncbi:Uncharacterized protein OBRU01_10487 [Operophtera brumata]|uniref:Peptidase S1 domain-containing protein n=1 Tax=Operophtera brumata TaxID=104452 RepID=A0A0L7LDR2_OPEBR|nr:Uncharacterized protein OBRU01_10487 [Operophtera brumata]
MPPKECGGSNQENRIVGGMPAGVNRYPWMARLVYDGQFHCGASLLTKEYVLTAAHCVRKPAPAAPTEVVDCATDLLVYHTIA